MVVAPEHPLVGALTAAGRAAEVGAYVAAAGAKSDLERTDLARGKSGVDTGAPSPACTAPRVFERLRGLGWRAYLSTLTLTLTLIALCGFGVLYEIL